MSQPMRNVFRLFRHDQRGTFSLEFVLLVPILLSLLLGVTEMTRFLMLNEKSQSVSSTVADLVSQEQPGTLTTVLLTDLLRAAADVMSPYAFAQNGVVIISSVTQTGTATTSNPPKVSWQVSGGGSYSAGSNIGSPGNTANMPVGFTMDSGDNIIVAEVYYNYTPLYGTTILSGRLLYKTSYYKPRLGALSAPPT